jgi:hypothetical protein
MMTNGKVLDNFDIVKNCVTQKFYELNCRNILNIHVVQLINGIFYFLFQKK